MYAPKSRVLMPFFSPRKHDVLGLTQVSSDYSIKASFTIDIGSHLWVIHGKCMYLFVKMVYIESTFVIMKYGIDASSGKMYHIKYCGFM